jgi:hypothetical protein
VTVREYGLGVGADLIGNFSSTPKGAVATYDNQINFSTLHQVTGGAVRDDLVLNALLPQVPTP